MILISLFIYIGYQKFQNRKKSVELNFYTNEITKFYNKRSQNPLNLLKAEEYIQKILLYKESNEFDNEFQKTVVFANIMKENILRRRLEILNEKEYFIFNTKKITLEIENIIDENYHGEKNYKKFDLTLNYKTLFLSEEPVVALYFLDQFLPVLDQFIIVFEKYLEQDNIYNLSNKQFLDTLQSMRQEAVLDFRSLMKNYSLQLEEMKRRVAGPR